MAEQEHQHFGDVLGGSHSKKDSLRVSGGIVEDHKGVFRSQGKL